VKSTVNPKLFKHLEATSRSFYLGITRLEEPLKSQICLGYLLCRVWDSFEDATSVDAQFRINCLRDFYLLFKKIINTNSVESRNQWLRDYLELKGSWNLESSWTEFQEFHPRDYALLLESEILLSEISKLGHREKTIFVERLTPMAEGMVKEISKRQLVENKTPREKSEFLEYCYWVAGTVGEFLTDLFDLNEVFVKETSKDELLLWGRSFGTVLQTVNISKDFFADWAEGRCFWLGMNFPQGMKSTPPESRLVLEGFRKLVEVYDSELPNAQKYIKAIKPEFRAIRFFCRFPLEMAQLTIAEGSRSTEWINKKESFKVNKHDVLQLMGKLAALMGICFSFNGL
jgi:phytoene/squalene synthetase